MKSVNRKYGLLKVALIALFAIVVCVHTHAHEQELASIQTEQTSIDSFIKYYNDGEITTSG